MRDKTYAPLTRPLFLYVNRAAVRQPAVRTFVTYYLDHIAGLAQEAGYVPLSRAESGRQRAVFNRYAGIPAPTAS